MNIEHETIAKDLLQRALDRTDEPARAASVLMSAAAAILQRHFGEETAIELMQHGLDTAGAEWRRGQLN